MFDFMKDLYFEINDFDMEKMKEEKNKKIEKEKAETVILNKSTKKILFFAGLIFLIVSIGTLTICINKFDVMGIIKNSLLILIDAATIICMMIKQKKTEIASLIGMAIIIIITFSI